MGGVDLLDSLISKSKFNMKSRRWYLYIFWHSLQLMVTNAWLVYHRDCDILGIPKKERLILRKFQTRIGLALCYSKTTPRRGRPCLDNDANDQPPAAEAEAERLRLEEEEKKKLAIPLIQDPRKRRIHAHLNPSGAQTGVPATATGMLPKINMSTSLFNGRIETKEEEELRLAQAAEEERKRKQKELPRFDKELVKEYLDEQKSMHEDLLTRNALMKIKSYADNDHVFYKYRMKTRNALMKIKSYADNDHVFYKYRMKTRLPGSAHSLLQHIELERPLEPGEVRPPTRHTSRPDTRQTTRSDTSHADRRQSGRPDTRQTVRSESRQTTRPDTRQTSLSEGPKVKVKIRPWTKQASRYGQKATPRRQGRASLGDAPLESDVDTQADNIKGSVTSRTPAQGKDALSIPKMERAKTVHFS
ncbi:PiggyBac transposable element-derived protein 4 [Plakobranchus ocellatus]|uniref:PiggyBac transposable element-derived protein 4 n=1 Tax=Plakobranchus ocellatus TaxID=259542 RepID=A0AAV4AEE4_9GAST|nr:PiggyBac transposable element-derived protein 4 [Plakobranchus ocellatus]